MHYLIGKIQLHSLMWGINGMRNASQHRLHAVNHLSDAGLFSDRFRNALLSSIPYSHMWKEQ